MAGRVLSGSLPVAAALICLGAPAAVLAQCGQVGCGLCPSGTSCGIEQIPGTLPSAPGCLGLFCNQPASGGVQTTANQSGGIWTMRAEVAVDVPGNRQVGFPLCSADGYWFESASPQPDLNTATGVCHSGSWDRFKLFLEIGGLTCGNLSGNAALKVYSLSVVACRGGGSCEKRTDVPAIDLGPAAAGVLLGCPSPPPTVCGEPGGATSGEAGLSCPLCQPVGAGGGGGGCSVPVGGGGPSCEPDGLGKAQVRYAAGGVGGDNLPGSTAWRTTLGRFWTHDFAERIVIDPDASHVWLLTRYGSFREFSNLAPGGGLRLYQSRAPSDEFRKLYFDTATGGWELHTLDGRKDIFRSDGLWLQTVFASDPSHSIQGTYNASSQLVSVSFPDGRSDSFTYHPNGKLAPITEVAVSGSGTTSRTWNLTWPDVGDRGHGHLKRCHDELRLRRPGPPCFCDGCRKQPDGLHLQRSRSSHRRGVTGLGHNKPYLQRARRASDHDGRAGDGRDAHRRRG